VRSGVRTVAELAGRLGVDGRTVRRYVDHLLDLDVPVESVRGRFGGYRLAPGHRMPPLTLNDEEALAVLLGLVAGRRAGLMTATGTAAERLGPNGWWCTPRAGRMLYLRVRSAALSCSANWRQAVGVKRRTRPVRSLESRIMMRSRTVTSTQLAWDPE
jgi:hypothetical protein